MKNSLRLHVELMELVSLESLNVACNQLTTLPPAIGKLAKLRCLNVTQNRITHLPDGKNNCTTLMHVLCFSRWSVIYCVCLLELWEAPHLEQLLASSNKISFISPSILHCQSLHTLILDSNRLTELPVQVTRLLNLKRLSVCGNNLTALPNGRLSYIINLLPGHNYMFTVSGVNAFLQTSPHYPNLKLSM